MEELKYRILEELNDYLFENEILIEDEEHLQTVLEDFYSEVIIDYTEEKNSLLLT